MVWFSVLDVVSGTTYSGLYAVLERESKLQKRLLITPRDNIILAKALQLLGCRAFCLTRNEGKGFSLPSFILGQHCALTSKLLSPALFSDCCLQNHRNAFFIIHDMKTNILLF